MPTALNVHDILSKIERLHKEEQLNLLEKLVAIIRKKERQNTPVKLSKLTGIGSGIGNQLILLRMLNREGSGNRKTPR